MYLASKEVSIWKSFGRDDSAIEQVRKETQIG